MTLALLMFIYGMYRYWLRIYTRFALSSDRMITGEFAEIVIQFAEIVMGSAEMVIRHAEICDLTM